MHRELPRLHFAVSLSDAENILDGFVLFTISVDFRTLSPRDSKVSRSAASNTTRKKLLRHKRLKTIGQG